MSAVKEARIERHVTITKVLFVLILLLGIGLQLAGAIQKSFWGDEAYTAIVTQGKPENMEEYNQVRHPLYYYMMSYWGRLFDFDELGLRSSSIIFALLTLILTYILSRDLSNDKTALISILILGLSPLFVQHAHDARYYALMSCLAVLAALSVNRYINSGKFRYLMLYSLAGALILYMAFTCIVFIVGCNIWWLGVRIRDRKLVLNELVYWGLANILILLIFMPALNRLNFFVSYNMQTALVSNWSLELIKRLVYSAYAFSLGGTLSPLNPIAWIGLEAVLLIAGYAIFSAHRSRGIWLPVFFSLWSGIFGTLITFFSSFHNLIWQNLTHWFFYILPFLSIWLGMGLARMKLKVMIFLGCLLFITYGISGINYFSNRQFIQPIFTIPWRTIFETISQKARPDALVICSDVQIDCEYYAKRYGFTVSLPQVLESESSASASEVWWINVNLGGFEYDRQVTDQKFLEFVSNRYPLSEISNYVQQDQSIRWLKTKVMGHADYEYLVNVYHFYFP